MTVDLRQKLILIFSMLSKNDLIFSDFFLVKKYIFSSTFRRKKVELLSSLRRQHLGRLSFMSESISQKLSKVSI